jgi:uncharacterized protein (DUF362 family)/Pyruvate/2-oxoacid:ferredoxin oxidoreductase delta subunit
MTIEGQMESVVSVRRHDRYDLPGLKKVLERAIEDVGGVGAFVRSGERVLFKPNLLLGSAPEAAIVTHPVFVEALAELAVDAGAKVFIGESPPFGKLNWVLSKCGYEPWMRRLGVAAAPFIDTTPKEFGADRLFRRIDLACAAFEYDRVINLPKLKTHCQMFLTLAVKNLFGAVVGSQKAAWHLKAGTDHHTFAAVLVQILEAVNPSLSILDGILAMEGDGPNNGTPRRVGVAAASKDAIALDATVCRLLGFPVDRLLTCVIGEQYGLGRAAEQDVGVVGDDLTGFPLRDFRAPKTMTMTWNMGSGGFLLTFLRKRVAGRPRIDPKLCQKCGVCLAHCPPKAIAEIKGEMRIDGDKCISCYCCHELCAFHAIRITEPRLGKLLARLTR